MERKKNSLPERFSLKYLALWLCGDDTDGPIAKKDTFQVLGGLAFAVGQGKSEVYLPPLNAWHKDKPYPPYDDFLGSILDDEHKGTDWEKYALSHADEILINREDFVEFIYPKCEDSDRCHTTLKGVTKDGKEVKMEPFDSCGLYGECKKLGQGEKFEEYTCAINECPPYAQCLNSKVAEYMKMYEKRINEMPHEQTSEQPAEAIAEKPEKKRVGRWGAITAGRFSLSPDGRSTNYNGVPMTFSTNQARIIEIMLGAHPQELSGQYILVEIESNSTRLRDSFRNHPAWNTLIKKGSKSGFYRLDI